METGMSFNTPTGIQSNLYFIKIGRELGEKKTWRFNCDFEWMKMKAGNAEEEKELKMKAI